MIIFALHIFQVLAQSIGAQLAYINGELWPAMRGIPGTGSFACDYLALPTPALTTCDQSSAPCVECDAIGGAATKVQAIQWYNSGLSGTIPTSIAANLPELIELKASSNVLGSTLPSTLLQMTALREISLSNNLLNGHINDVMNNPNIVRVWLDKNSFAGSIASISPQLKVLVVRQNLLGHALPDVSDAHQLRTLDVSNNYLIGDVPALYATLAQLRTFAIQNNFFRKVPEHFVSYARIEKFTVQYNELCQTDSAQWASGVWDPWLNDSVLDTIVCKGCVDARLTQQGVYRERSCFSVDIEVHSNCQANTHASCSVCPLCWDGPPPPPPLPATPYPTPAPGTAAPTPTPTLLPSLAPFASITSAPSSPTSAPPSPAETQAPSPTLPSRGAAAPTPPSSSLPLGLSLVALLLIVLLALIVLVIAACFCLYVVVSRRRCARPQLGASAAPRHGQGSLRGSASSRSLRGSGGGAAQPSRRRARGSLRASTTMIERKSSKPRVYAVPPPPSSAFQRHYETGDLEDSTQHYRPAAPLQYAPAERFAECVYDRV